MCAYMYAKESHPFAERSHKLGLLNARVLYQIRDLLNDTPEGHALELGPRLGMHFYALLDLCCKAYLCGIGDRLMEATSKSGDAEQGMRVRNFYLNRAEVTLAKMRQCYFGKEDFAELLYKLWQLNDLLTD